MSRFTFAVVLVISIASVVAALWLGHQQVVRQHARDSFFAPLDLSAPRDYPTMEPIWNDVPEVGDELQE